MSRYSVEIGSPVQSYDIVVGRPNKAVYDRRIVRLVRGDGKDSISLCEIWPGLSGPHSWSVIVYPADGQDEDSLEGPSLVDGFAKITDAWTYAVLIRTDINQRHKARQK